jgi:hypothetical protein
MNHHLFLYWDSPIKILKACYLLFQFAYLTGRCIAFQNKIHIYAILTGIKGGGVTIVGRVVAVLITV